MPLTITNSTPSGAEVGAGAITLVDLEGGVNAGDYVEVFVFLLPESDNINVAYGICRFPSAFVGGSNIQVLVGIEKTNPFTYTNIRPQAYPVNDGASVGIRFNWRTSAAALRATVSNIGFTWRHAAGVGNLADALQALAGSAISADVADIRAAVYRTFPSAT